MATVKVYTKSTCPYCIRAKELFNQLGQSFDEVSVDNDPNWKETLGARTGSRTVPQIFINEEFVGGCDDLIALHDSGKLEQLLKS